MAPGENEFDAPDTFLVHFYRWHKVRVRLYSLAGKYPVAPVPFVEKTTLSPLNGLGTLVEIS